MTPDRPHSDTVGRVANEVRVEGGENHGPKYRSSDALSAPKIFLDAPFFLFTVTCVFLISMMILLGEVMKWNPKIPMLQKNQN